MLKQSVEFLSSNFDNVAASFFVDQLGQKVVLIRLYSIADTPQTNWIRPWLGWETIYVETICRVFGAWNLTT